MKRLFVILLTVTLFASCENPEYVKYDIEQLKSERELLQKDVNYLKKQLTELEGELTHLGLIKEGKDPVYIIKISIKQEDLDLMVNPTEEVTNMLNEVKFELPVDRHFYNSVDVGTNLFEKMNDGTLALTGKRDSWRVKVIDKRIQ